MTFVVRVSIAVVGGAAVAVAALAGANQPQGFWLRHAFAFYAAVAAIGLSGVIHPLAEAVRDRVVQRALARRYRVETMLRAAFVRIVDQGTIDFRQLGVGAYLVGREHWYSLRQVMVPVGRVRLTATPAFAAVRWTRGKGVIGVCWQRGMFAAADLTGLGAFALDALPAEWSALDAQARLGLTLQEARRTSMYKVVAAMPIVVDGRVQGCVAADGPQGTFAALTSERVKVLLAETAQAVWLAST